MKRRTCLLFVATALTAAAAVPDLSGTWELNIAASKFDRQAPPEKATDTFIHKDPDLEMQISHVEQGRENKGTLKYRTDGTEGTNDVMGTALRFKAAWESDKLVITTTGKFGDNEIKLIDRYSISGDKSRLTLERRYEGRCGPQEQVLVFDRQQPR